jgi:hypothetical protein
LLLAAGLGVRAVFLVMVSAAVAFGLVGVTLVLLGVQEWKMLVLVFAGGAGLVLLFRNAHVLLRFVPPNLRRAAPQSAAPVSDDRAGLM